MYCYGYPYAHPPRHIRRVLSRMEKQTFTGGVGIQLCILTTKKDFTMDKSGNAVADLVDVCRKMLSYIKEDTSAMTEKDSIIKTAEVALERAEAEILWTRKRPASRFYFGRLGSHYDFKLKVTNVQETEGRYCLDCVDKHGRDYAVLAYDKYVQFRIKAGMHLYFRGRITDQQIVNNRPVTFIEVVSVLQNINTGDEF